MVLIRVFEEETDRQYKRNRIGGYCHLCSGQEGATVGACAALERDDLPLTSYRSHGIALARGVCADVPGRSPSSHSTAASGPPVRS